MSTPSGFPVPVTDESKCTGHCEGGCPLLQLDQKLFRRGDKNARRKIAKIEYKEAEYKIRNKVQEIRNPKYLPGPGLCYGGAVLKAERPRVIFIDQEVDQEGHEDQEDQEDHEDHEDQEDQEVEGKEDFETLDPLDDVEIVDCEEPRVVPSSSKKIKIDMKKRNEVEKEIATDKDNVSNIKADIITETPVEELNDQLIDELIDSPENRGKNIASQPNRSQRRSRRVPDESEEQVVEKKQETESENMLKKRRSRSSPQNQEQVEEKAAPKTQEENVLESKDECQTDSTLPIMNEQRMSRANRQKKEEVGERELDLEIPKKESKNGGKGKKSSGMKYEASVKEIGKENVTVAELENGVKDVSGEKDANSKESQQVVQQQPPAVEEEKNATPKKV